MKSWNSFCFVLLMVSGCTSQPIQSTLNEGETTLTPVPDALSFAAPTLGRDVDGGTRLDLRTSFDGPVLLLWVAAGCNGCHDWTALLRQEIDSGRISNSTNIISVHRYPEIESFELMTARYGDVNSTTYAPWPVMLPPTNTNVIDANSGRMTDVSIYRAFQQPVTPTLQVLDGDGRLVWTSKTYWANSTVLAEALNIMETSRY